METFSSVPTRGFGVFSAELWADNKLFPKSDWHQLTDPIWLLLKKKRESILIHSLAFFFFKNIFLDELFSLQLSQNQPSHAHSAFVHCSLFAVQIQLYQLICCYNNTQCAKQTIHAGSPEAHDWHMASTTAWDCGRLFHNKIDFITQIFQISETGLWRGTLIDQDTSNYILTCINDVRCTIQETLEGTATSQKYSSRYLLPRQYWLSRYLFCWLVIILICPKWHPYSGYLKCAFRYYIKIFD